MPTQIQPLTIESLKQLLNDFEWDVLDDIKPTADTELTDAVIITGFKVSLGSLAMYIEFFSLKKFQLAWDPLTFSHASFQQHGYAMPSHLYLTS